MLGWIRAICAQQNARYVDAIMLLRSAGELQSMPSYLLLFDVPGNSLLQRMRSTRFEIMPPPLKPRDIRFSGIVRKEMCFLFGNIRRTFTMPFRLLEKGPKQNFTTSETLKQSAHCL